MLINVRESRVDSVKEETFFWYDQCGVVLGFPFSSLGILFVLVVLMSNQHVNLHYQF